MVFDQDENYNDRNRNRDILISTAAAVMAGALMFVARMGMFGMMFGGMRGQGKGRHGQLSTLKKTVGRRQHPG